MKAISKRLVAALAVILLAPPAGANGLISGQFSIGGGYLEHPLGVSGDDAAGYATQTLRLQLNARQTASSWRLGYEGSGHQFSGEQPLDQMHHALGLEWFGTAAENRWKLSGGLQVAGRLRSDIYETYNFTEASGYFSFKTYLREGLLARGYAQVRDRRYGDLPEEGFLESSIQMELQRFLPSGTTIGSTIGWGWKAYRDPAAERVWETDGMPTTSLLRLRINAAQSLSERASLRGSFYHRWSLVDFPYLVREDLFDSPILDAYASSGTQVATTLRILGPWQIWLEPSASYAQWDYGQSLFPGPEGAVGRQDELFRGSVTFERTFGSAGSTGPKARFVAGWREQMSSLDVYDLSGPELSTALVWSW